MCWCTCGLPALDERVREGRQKHVALASKWRDRLARVRHVDKRARSAVHKERMGAKTFLDVDVWLHSAEQSALAVPQARSLSHSVKPSDVDTTPGLLRGPTSLGGLMSLL